MRALYSKVVEVVIVAEPAVPEPRRRREPAAARSV